MGIACLKGASLTITARCFIMEPLWCDRKVAQGLLKSAQSTHTLTRRLPPRIWKANETLVTENILCLCLTRCYSQVPFPGWIVLSIVEICILAKHINEIGAETPSGSEFLISFFFSLSSPRRRACALRGLGLLLVDSAPIVGRGKTFWLVNCFFFYENGCNSGTESRKIAPKVGNDRSLQGLQTGRWPKLGSYGSYGFLDQRTRFRAQKTFTS